MSAGDRQQQAIEDKHAARRAAQRAKAARAGRDPGSFVPWLKPVQESPGWRRASHTARSLLMDMIHSGPNGKLSSSMKYLRAFGWTSAGTVSRAVAELVECGLLMEMRRGSRPNVSAWHACTWIKLQDVEGINRDTVKAFKTGGYMTPTAPAEKSQRSRTAKATEAKKKAAVSRANGYTLTPSDGATGATAYTVRRCNDRHAAPSDGAIEADSTSPSTPLDGAYLDIPICVQPPPPKDTAMTKYPAVFLNRRLPALSIRPAAYHAARARLPFNAPPFN